jgi:hypothetical protein
MMISVCVRVCVCVCVLMPGNRNFQATGSTPVSLACALPYNPNSCFPCFAHECNGTTFEVVSDYVGDPVEESLDWG